MKFYIAKRSCGCIVGGRTDRPGQDRKIIAKWIAEWIKDGLTIEHIEAESVAIPTGPCAHEKRDGLGPLFAVTRELARTVQTTEENADDNK